MGKLGRLCLCRAGCARSSGRAGGDVREVSVGLSVLFALVPADSARGDYVRDDGDDDDLNRDAADGQGAYGQVFRRYFVNG